MSCLNPQNRSWTTCTPAQPLAYKPWRLDSAAICSLFVPMAVWDEYAIYLTLTDDWVATMPTMRRAFDYVLDLGGLDYHLEQRAGVHSITFNERRPWTPPTFTSSKPIDGDARSELMRSSLVGRLKGFAAMPVREWRKKVKKPRQ
jgi:hypothetical protein